MITDPCFAFFASRDRSRRRLGDGTRTKMRRRPNPAPRSVAIAQDVFIAALVRLERCWRGRLPTPGAAARASSDGGGAGDMTASRRGADRRGRIAGPHRTGAWHRGAGGTVVPWQPRFPREWVWGSGALGGGTGSQGRRGGDRTPWGQRQGRVAVVRTTNGGTGLPMLIPVAIQCAGQSNQMVPAPPGSV